MAAGFLTADGICTTQFQTAAYSIASAVYPYVSNVQQGAVHANFIHTALTIGSFNSSARTFTVHGRFTNVQGNNGGGYTQTFSVASCDTDFNPDYGFPSLTASQGATLGGSILAAWALSYVFKLARKALETDET